MSDQIISVENDPGCVKNLRGITVPGILGPVVMRRAKKHKNLSSARHDDQIGFRFRTAKTHSGHFSSSRAFGCRYSKRRVISSSGMSVTFVVQISPALTGMASVNVPVEIISPARSGGLRGSFANNSTR